MSSTVFVCNICNKLFKAKSNMKRHMKTVHLNIADFMCIICEKKFKRKFSLKKHMIKIHDRGDQDNSGEPVSIKLEEDSASNLQHHDNSINMCDESTVMKQNNCDDNSNSVCSISTGVELANQESSVLQHENNSSNTYGKRTAEEQLKEDGKSDTVYNESTAMEQEESLDMDDEDESSGSCDNTAVGSMPVGQGESNTVVSDVICLIPENVDDKLTCQFCFQKFKYKSNKTRHLRRVHNIKTQIPRPLECSYCKSKFKHACRLQEHVNQVHGKNMDGTEASKIGIILVLCTVFFCQLGKSPNVCQLC